MKKLMVVAAVALAAAATQAASFCWKTSGIKDVEGSDTVTCEAVLTAYATGTSDVIATYTQTITAGKVAGSTSGYTFSDDKFVGGSTYDFVFVATTTYGGKDYTWTSTTKSMGAQATSTPSLSWFAANHTTGDDINANGWKPVPEPTSALLMLLGMAGLALRRKQA